MKVWILGKCYDIDSVDDRERLMDLIDNRRRDGAANDLSMVCYALLSVYLMRENQHANS